MLLCGVAGVACAVGPGLWAGLLGVLVGGGLYACCLLPRQISGRRAASNRSGCLCVVRPGPAAHGYRGLASSIAQDSHRVVTSHIPEPAPNFACNSPTTLSNHEFTTLELQCFQTLLKLHPIELRASFLGGVRMGAAGGVAGSR